MSTEPFKTACDLELPISKISDFAMALMMMSETTVDSAGSNVSMAIYRLAAEIRDQAKVLDEIHGVLFQALHPGPGAIISGKEASA